MRGLDVDGLLALGGHVAVELGAIVVPLEGVEAGGAQVVGAAQRCLAPREGVARHVHTPQQVPRRPRSACRTRKSRVRAAG